MVLRSEHQARWRPSVQWLHCDFISRYMCLLRAEVLRASGVTAALDDLAMPSCRSCRGGLPSQSVQSIRTHTATFRRLACLPLRPRSPNIRSTGDAVANIKKNTVHCASRHRVRVFPPYARQFCRARSCASPLQRGSPCGSVDPRSAGMLNRI